ncbi:MBL fold metallo-hydrolase [Paenibacillus ferrarius]|uniref:MBL fold metallo-hydrolase n=1 Tax=Paenibacillus ferrarius TaxID=1469647 RepID=UPI003D2B002F
MKIQQISKHIWSVRAWMIIPCHVWLVVEAEGITLVDAGVPWMAGSIQKLIDRLGAGPLRRIVLTHGHPDHVGSIKKIVQASPVPIYAHRLEIPCAEGDLPYPGKSKPVPQVAKGLLRPLTELAEGEIASIGALRPFFTPGHSPGHVVYYHEKDDVLLTGDLFNSKRGKLLPPRATPNPDEARRSARIVEILKPHRLEVCHGDTVYRPAEQMDDFFKIAKR